MIVPTILGEMMSFETLILALMLLVTFVFRKQLIHEIKMQALPNYAKSERAKISQEREALVTRLVGQAVASERVRLNLHFGQEQRVTKAAFDSLQRQLISSVGSVIDKLTQTQIPDLVSRCVRAAIEAEGGSVEVVASSDYASFLRSMYASQDLRDKRAAEEDEKRRAFIENLLAWAKENANNEDASRYLQETLAHMEEELSQLSDVYKNDSNTLDDLGDEDFARTILGSRMAECRIAMRDIEKEKVEIVQALSNCS